MKAYAAAVSAVSSLVAINATGVGVRAIGEAAGVSKSSVHNFLRGGDLTPDALDALARYVEKHG